MQHDTIIVRALQTLADRCDGAHAEDGVGFNGRDTDFGRSLAAQSRTKPLSEKQLLSAVKMLQTYRQQLLTYGIAIPTFTEYARHRQPNGQPSRQPVRRRPTVYASWDNKSSLVLTFDYDVDVKNRIKSIAGSKFHAGTKSWSIPATALDELRDALDGFTTLSLDDSVQDLNQVLEAREATAEAAQQLSRATSADLVVDGLGGDLMPFQRAGVQFVDVNHGIALIGDEMGLGKTVQALAYLQMHPELRPALIVVPASLKSNWQRETEKWVRDNNSTVILSGRKPPIDGTSAHIYIINYDIVPYWKEWLAGLNPAVLICDEAHYLKTTSANRTKAVRHIAQRSQRRILMTGTPIMNRPAELWSLLNILDPMAYPTFFPFAMRYCDARKKYIGRGREVWDFSGASNLGELHEQLKRIMVRRRKSEVLTELPAKRRVQVPIELPETIYKQLMQIERSLYYAHGDMLPGAHLVAMNEMRQLVGHGKLAMALEWVADFIESEKLILFMHHKFMVDAVMDQFASVAVAITGDTPQAQRQEAVDKFQNDEDTRLFVGNIQAAGVGLTLTAASNVAFLELGWRPGDLTQAEDRAHRIGQQNSVTCWYLLAANTIDTDMFGTIEAKRHVVEQVTDGEIQQELTFDRQNIITDTLGRFVQRVGAREDSA